MTMKSMMNKLRRQSHMQNPLQHQIWAWGLWMSKMRRQSERQMTYEQRWSHSSKDQQGAGRARPPGKREYHKVEREFGHLSEYNLHTNEIFWVSNASLLCNGRHAERWQQSNLYQACTFEKSLKNSMRASMFPSLKLELDLNCLPTPVNLAGRQCQAATF